jgi:hypothetical protein
MATKNFTQFDLDSNPSLLGDYIVGYRDKDDKGNPITPVEFKVSLNDIANYARQYFMSYANEIIWTPTPTITFIGWTPTPTITANINPTTPTPTIFTPTPTITPTTTPTVSQTNPAPVKQRFYELNSLGGLIYGSQTYKNPYWPAYAMHIVGTVSDEFLIDGVPVNNTFGSNSIDVTVETETIEYHLLVSNDGVASYNLTIYFVPSTLRLTPTPTNTPTETQTIEFPSDYVSFLNKIDPVPNFANTEYVTNGLIAKQIDTTRGDTFSFGGYGGVQNLVGLNSGAQGINIVTTRHKNYTFVYTNYGNDWILRRNNLTNQWTVVAYMYSGNKYQDYLAFINSSSTTMQWGGSLTNTIEWTNLLYDDSYYNNLSNILYFREIGTAQDPKATPTPTPTTTKTPTYTQSSTPTPTFNANNQWSSLVSTKGILVGASKTDNQILYSIDSGETWNVTSLTNTVEYGSFVVYAIDTIGFIVLKNNSATYYISYDGINWIPQVLPISTPQTWVGFASDPNQRAVILASNSDTAYYTQRLGLVDTRWIPIALPSKKNWASIAYGNGTFVATCIGDSAVTYSTDGLHWNTSNIPLGSNNWQSITFGNGLFVTITRGDSLAAYSVDGITWNVGQLPNIASWNKITYTNDFSILKQYVAIAGYNERSVSGAVSRNGKDWTSFSLPSSLVWASIAYDTSLRKYYAIANGSSIVASANDNNLTNWTTINVVPH